MTPRQKLATGLSAAALALALPLITHYEGLRTRTYRDPVGIPTVCYGHTGPDVRMGQTYTHDQCLTLLLADLDRHAAALACIHRPLTDGQRAAFTSLAYNIGNQAFCRSTLVKRANAGDMASACAELDKWIYAAGRPLPGLIQRRAAERAVCEGRPWQPTTHATHGRRS